MNKELVKIDYSNYVGGVTGTNINRYNKIPYIIALKSQVTFDAFKDKENLKVTDMGKLFVRDSVNYRSDLVDSITGIIIKVERGSEMWLDNKLVHSSTETLNESEKIEIAKKNGVSLLEKNKFPKNVIKITIKLDSPMVLANGRKLDYVVHTLKGQDYMEYVELEKKQSDILAQNNMPNADYKVCIWKVTLKTVSGNNANGSTFFTKFDVSLTPAEQLPEALKMVEFMANTSFFRDVEVDVETKVFAKEGTVTGADLGDYDSIF